MWNFLMKQSALICDLLNKMVQRTKDSHVDFLRTRIVESDFSEDL